MEICQQILETICAGLDFLNWQKSSKLMDNGDDDDDAFCDDDDDAYCDGDECG